MKEILIESQAIEILRQGKSITNLDQTVRFYFRDARMIDNVLEYGKLTYAHNDPNFELEFNQNLLEYTPNSISLTGGTEDLRRTPSEKEPISIYLWKKYREEGFLAFN